MKSKKIELKMRKETYPQKTTINMVMREKDMNSPSRALPVFAVVMVLILLFGKFAVADRYGQLLEEQRKVDVLSSTRDQLQTALEDYDAVREEYQKYSSDWMTEDEIQLVGRIDILGLIDSVIQSRGRVDNISVRENVVSINMSQVTLREAAVIVSALQEDKMVNQVTVYTAGTAQEGVKTTVSMTITLNSSMEQREAAGLLTDPGLLSDDVDSLAGNGAGEEDEL